MLPQITLTEFKAMSVAEIKAEGSFEVTADGSYLCTVISPQGESTMKSFAREQAKQVAIPNNSIMPK